MEQRANLLLCRGGEKIANVIESLDNALRHDSNAIDRVCV